MSFWIAYEHDETGWPTEAFLIVAAGSQAEARQIMVAAITARREIEDSRETRARLSEIFIEAPLVRVMASLGTNVMATIRTTVSLVDVVLIVA